MILLGEDYEDDVLLFRHSMKKAGINMDVTVLDSGEKIADYLQGTQRAGPAQRPMPSLIVLDGQLHHQPSMGLLRWIVNDPKFKHIPVIVLTGSLDPKITEQAKRIGAQECFEKPLRESDWKRLKELLPKPLPRKH